MSTRQESTHQRRWSDLLLGSAAAGLGAPLLLRGLRRVLHPGSRNTPVGMGWKAGLLGALVAGGLARRRLHAGARSGDTEASEEAAASSEVAAARESEARFDAGHPASSMDVDAMDTGAALEGEEDAEGLVADWRREVRRRRLAALEPRVAAHAEASGHEVFRAMERRPRRGPSGREQPWHEALVPTSG
jgi:hypothetical protein